MTGGAPLFLPASGEQMRQRGWDRVDVILVTGDAYVDHPAFGVALIGRLLEAHGYRVAILAQPRHDSPEDFRQFGAPRLFWGITAGNLDSIVANYTGNGRVRDQDAYSPGGNPYFGTIRSRAERRRPDRATIRYANLARSACGDVPVVLGGIEASLRRFSHYDYQQAKLRASVLTDAKADLLVYGMGERAVLEIAGRCAEGRDLASIPGTCQRLTETEMDRSGHDTMLTLPSYAEICRDKKRFLQAELAVDQHARSLSGAPVRQRQQALWVVQHPPAAPLSTQELDRLYGLPYTRRAYPGAPQVPAARMIRHSLTIVRGCFGNCSFCAIARHQGPLVTCRSEESIVAEAATLARLPDFRGTITDLGGPTANLYGTRCRSPRCRRHDCLQDGVCPSIEIDEGAFVRLLDRVGRLAGVKNVFISSGLRMELLLKTPNLLGRIINDHTPGTMKIAPEHTEARVLKLMHKHKPELLEEFLRLCRTIASAKRRTLRINPYLISAHPGCTQADMEAMADKIVRLGLEVRQFQDFTPTPGTLSTAMFVSGLDRDTFRKIHVPRSNKERKSQRSVLEKIRTGSRG